jgi:hypothetical protein
VAQKTTVQFVNNSGTGSIGSIEIETPDGTTPKVSMVMKQNGLNPNADYTIRVNNQPANAETQVRSGDRVTVAPSKVAGA